jgi:hypothetical protein
MLVHNPGCQKNVNRYTIGGLATFRIRSSSAAFFMKPCSVGWPMSKYAISRIIMQPLNALISADPGVGSAFGVRGQPAPRTFVSVRLRADA